MKGCEVKMYWATCISGSERGALYNCHLGVTATIYGTSRYHWPHFPGEKTEDWRC